MDFEEYDKDRDKVIEENKKAGVAAIINNCSITIAPVRVSAGNRE